MPNSFMTKADWDKMNDEFKQRLMEPMTTEELTVEIGRRAAIAVGRPPEPLASPDFSPVRDMVLDGVARMIKDGYQDDDLDRYLAEACFTAVYGPAYWVWRRQQKY